MVNLTFRKAGRYGLDCRIVANVSKLSEDEWLELRKQGITGTDLAGITGISRYSSPTAVYMNKLGLIEDKVDNDFMRWGRIMESIIRDEFQRKNQEFDVKPSKMMFCHKDKTWMRANVDGLIYTDEGVGILEIKTADKYLTHLWKGEEVPVQYMTQIQWYMAVTGAKFGYFAVLIGGNTYVQKRVNRDDELIEILTGLAEDFYLNNILKKVIPVVDGSEATGKLLNTLYGDSKNNVLEMGERETELLNERETLLLEKEAIDERLSLIENSIKDVMQENDTLVNSSFKVTWKTQTRKSIDSKKLRELNPSLADEVTKESKNRVFKVRRIQEK